MSDRKPILCLDFDGVIHSYTSGWKGADLIPDRPVDGAIPFIREALKHFRVAIYSSRSGQPGGIPAMKLWLEYWGNRFPGLDDADNRDRSWLDQIEWPTEKPPAMVTLDDRALTFTGEWPSMDALKAFKPWNKGSRVETLVCALDEAFLTGVVMTLTGGSANPNVVRSHIKSIRKDALDG